VTDYVDIWGRETKKYLDEFLMYKTNDKNCIDYDKSKILNKPFQDFICRFDWFTLKKLLNNDNLTIDTNNELLQLFINKKITTMETTKSIIMEMCNVIKTQLYLKSKEYHKRNKGILNDNNLQNSDWDFINNKTNAMRKEVTNILERSSSLVNFIHLCGKYFDKHSMPNFFDVDGVITLEFDSYDELKKLIYIYLITNKYKKENILKI
jgi:hypothetical protein